MKRNVGLARRRCSSAIAVALIALTLLMAQNAEAGLWLTITVAPEQPRALEPVTVTVQTLEASGCLTDPAVEATPIVAQSEPELEAMELHAIGLSEGIGTPIFPADQGILFKVTRNPDDLTLWTGTLTFPDPGEWTLRVTSPSFSGGPASCYGYAIDVTVLPQANVATPEIATPTS
jgi:uncharacterized membrane protein